MHGDLEGLLLDLQQFRGVPSVLGHVPVDVGRPTERAVRAVAVVVEPPTVHCAQAGLCRALCLSTAVPIELGELVYICGCPV
eukprot:5643323-Prymnesium_polylepis.1